MTQLSNEQDPAIRRLRGYAFDPSLSLDMDTSTINDIVYKINWEDLTPGPKGKYLEVVDYDPTLKCFYTPVDLNRIDILACEGLSPSESNPQFHQQMVYAVGMTTIQNFEKALGRKILWAPRQLNDDFLKKSEEYVQELRIYPHALRDANAYYSPQKKALLFGYFSATPADETLQMPNSLVFTCLSHDVITHEITHAILDGMHRNYNEPTNPDVLAFHEAFSDIVALFQHFSFAEVLKHQIAKTRGDLKSENMLGKLAQQFGTAIGSYGSLRDAIGVVDKKTNTWKPKQPNPDDYRNTMEAHQRGSILVAAVFEAFISIYKTRTADLMRIASNGTGILPAGELHPDLVNRLANEAAKSASHVLNMCIRALDYCPPVDITFGDYLRAIITADLELVIEDTKDYRLAFIGAFRRRGIYPAGIKTLSVESLQFKKLNLRYVPKPKSFSFDTSNQNDNKIDYKNISSIVNKLGQFLRAFAGDMKYVTERHEIFKITNDYMRGRFDNEQERINGLQRIINTKFPYSREFSAITGLAFVTEFEDLGVQRATKKNYRGPEFEIQNLRLVNRTGPNNISINQVVFSIIQTVRGYFKDDQFSTDLIEGFEEEDKIELKGGCTLIFDLDNIMLKYAISKPLIDVNNLTTGSTTLLTSRLKVVQSYLDNHNSHQNGFDNYFSDGYATEPFAFLHKH